MKAEATDSLPRPAIPAQEKSEERTFRIQNPKGINAVLEKEGVSVRIQTGQTRVSALRAIAHKLAEEKASDEKMKALAERFKISQQSLSELVRIMVEAQVNAEVLSEYLPTSDPRTLASTLRANGLATPAGLQEKASDLIDVMAFQLLESNHVADRQEDVVRLLDLPYEGFASQLAIAERFLSRAQMIYFSKELEWDVPLAPAVPEEAAPVTAPSLEITPAPVGQAAAGGSVSRHRAVGAAPVEVKPVTAMEAEPLELQPLVKTAENRMEEFRSELAKLDRKKASAMEALLARLESEQKTLRGEIEQVSSQELSEETVQAKRVLSGFLTELEFTAGNIRVEQGKLIREETETKEQEARALSLSKEAEILMKEATSSIQAFDPKSIESTAQTLERLRQQEELLRNKAAQLPDPQVSPLVASVHQNFQNYLTEISSAVATRQHTLSGLEAKREEEAERLQREAEERARAEREAKRLEETRLREAGEEKRKEGEREEKRLKEEEAKRRLAEQERKQSAKILKEARKEFEKVDKKISVLDRSDLLSISLMIEELTGRVTDYEERARLVQNRSGDPEVESIRKEIQAMAGSLSKTIEELVNRTVELESAGV